MNDFANLKPRHRHLLHPVGSNMHHLRCTRVSKIQLIDGAKLNDREEQTEAEAWSWLFAVSKWGRASRIDIFTFKAGITSKMMRTLLQEGRTTGHQGHSHTSASVSGIYATPEYYAMTEQTQDAGRYLPEKFAVFYVFEDIHLGGLPQAPPSMMLRLEDGREFPPLDYSVIRDSFHHRAAVVRFPNTDEHGSRLIGGKASYFELIAHQPADHSLQTMRWNLPITYPKELREGNELSLPTLFALLAGLLAVLSPCLLQLTVYYPIDGRVATISAKCARRRPMPAVLGMR